MILKLFNKILLFKTKYLKYKQYKKIKKNGDFIY